VAQDTSQEDHRLLLRELRAVIRLAVNSRPISSHLVVPALALRANVHQVKVRQVKVRQVKVHQEVRQAAVSLHEAHMAKVLPDRIHQEHRGLQELQELRGTAKVHQEGLREHLERLVLMAKVHRVQELQERLAGDILRVLQVLQVLLGSRRSQASLEWLWQELQPL